MRILKSHPLLKLVNSYLIDASQPSNISYLWNFGSLLAVCLIIQIVTGVTLAMHYNPSILEAFNSVEHIMRDVNNGWLVRYLHSNTASAFFFLVYLHIGRGIYYGSYRAPRTLTWVIGTITFIAMMATAFLGYWHSPKWPEFFLNIYLSNILLFIDNIINNNILVSLYSNAFGFSLMIFFLDNWILSDIKLLKYFQILTFISVLILLIFFAYDHIITTSFINCTKDSNDIYIYDHIFISKEVSKTIGQAVYNISSNISLSASIAGVFNVVINGISKSFIFSLKKLEWKFLDKILPCSSDKIVIYIYKLIRLNKNMSIFYTIIVIINLIIALCAIPYISFELINDLDKYIGIHIEYYKK